MPPVSEMTPGLAASIIGGQAQQDVQSQGPNTSMMMIGSQMDLVSVMRGVMGSQDAMVQELQNVSRELRILNQRGGTMGQIRNALVGREVYRQGGVIHPGQATQAGQTGNRVLQDEFEAAVKEAVVSAMNDIKNQSRRKPKPAPAAPAGGAPPTEPPEPPGSPPPPGGGTGGGKGPRKPRQAPSQPQNPQEKPSHPQNKHGQHAKMVENMRTRGGIQHEVLSRITGSERFQKWKPKGAVGQAVQAGLRYGAEEGGGFLGTAAEGLGALGLTGPLIAATGTVAAIGLTIRQVEDQRRQNAKWQEIMGGSNFAGFGQRAASRGFAVGQMGVMNSAEAQQLFFGVSQVGLQGPLRQNALNLAVENYKSMGMTIADSLNLITERSKHGQEGLAGVATALQSVTNAAKVAGENAREARALFTSTVATSSNVMGGAGAVGVSQALTTSLTSSGLQKIFGDTGLGSMVNENNIAMGAAQQRMTYGHALNVLNDPNTPTSQKLQLIQGPAWKWLSNRIPASVQQYIKANTKPGMSPSEITALGREALDRAGIDPRIGADMANLFGTPTQTPDQLGSFIVAAAGGLIDPERDAAALEAKAKPFQPVAGQRVARQLQQMKGQVTASSDVTPGQAYLMGVKRTGYESPIAQALVDQKMTDRKFKVKSAEGDKIVDFKTAMSTYYDQIASGVAIDMTTGAAVAASVGMPTITAKDMPNLGDSASQKNVGQGETLAHYTARTQTAADKAAGQAHVTVTLDATDWLKQKFRFLDTSTSSTDPNAALQPPPVQVTSSALHSGNP